ncbi:MAG TPA: TIGR04282 family arsenosugar biosynthesis glycosyltransferase, partial [Ktedonobacteraceae bacterium]|nr:TIGR04282 family arsenosugar biosynthesis glycosyltransferase [Ktedonobacteraceae bacterium]
GDEATLSLYQAFLTDLAQRFAAGPVSLCWAYTPPERDFATYATTLVPADQTSMRYIPQRGPDFAARLHQVFVDTQALHFQQTIVIGSDSPYISQAIINQARQALQEVDVVLGPAEDGGYYLIGMREPHDVFGGIPMSTSVVLTMTLEKVRHLGLSVRLLEPLFDVDELPELQRLAMLLQVRPELAPHTAAVLEQLAGLPL